MNQPDPTTDTDRRDRWRHAARDIARRDWADEVRCAPLDDGEFEQDATDLMAVADAEQAELRAEVARQTELREHWQQEVAHADARLRELERRLAGKTPPAAVPSAPTSRPALSEAERTMLAYALDQAQEHIWSRDGFTDEDQAAVDSLRSLAAVPAAEEQPDNGMTLDDEYAVDIDEDGLPFARILFEFPASTPGEKRMALVHGITQAVHGARFGADMAAAEETDEQRADREETEQAHAAGDHEYCGPTCEVQMPSDKLRNFILAKSYPGAAGMLDELLRRAAAPPAVVPQPEEA